MSKPRRQTGLVPSRTPNDLPPFIQGNTVCGRVVDIRQSPMFPSPLGKAASFLRGEPWQIGQHQWYETFVFVEPVDVADGSTERVLHIAGTADGVRPGNIVKAAVYERGGELHVIKMVNLTAQSAVRTSSEEALPMMGCLGMVILVLAVFGLGSVLLGAAQSGALAMGIATVLGGVVNGVALVLLQLLDLVLATIGPALIVIGFLIFLYRLIFH